jgi:lanosterol synthase
MFALESLSLVGETYETSQSARRACDFLVSKQRADGGWGESYKVCHSFRTYSDECSVWGQTCEACVWVEHENTQVVQTSWAAMALMYANYPHTEPIKNAVTLVMSRQLPVRCLVPLFVSSFNVFSPLQDGSWAQEAIEGIFNRTCAISYPNFKFSFTIWMLGKAHKYLEERDALPLKRG